MAILHPTGPFLESLAFLRDEGLFPRSRLIFIAHRLQRRSTVRLEQRARALGFPTGKVVWLRGLPRDPGFERFMSRYPATNPASTMPRVLLSTERFMPPAWRKQVAEVVRRTDGMLMPGGSSIPAATYGGKQFVEAVSRTPVRALYELTVLELLLGGKEPLLDRKPEYLVLGICHGHQALNVALGGSLYQSIPIEVYGKLYVQDLVSGSLSNMHKDYFLTLFPPLKRTTNGWFHPIRVPTPSRFVPRLGKVYVYSTHEQAIKDLGQDLRVVATSVDQRIIEAVQHTHFPHVLGVQWHPEKRGGWRAYEALPPVTRAFHATFWGAVSDVLRANHAVRRPRVSPLGTSGSARSPTIGGQASRP